MKTTSNAVPLAKVVVLNPNHKRNLIKKQEAADLLDVTVRYLMNRVYSTGKPGSAKPLPKGTVLHTNAGWRFDKDILLSETTLITAA